MAMLITDPAIEEALKAERELTGADRYDEVWEGVYMMTPLPNVEHQDLAAQFVWALKSAMMTSKGVGVYGGVNVSDREDDWEHNYRAPDVAVYLPDTRAKNCGTHWCGGPDFAIEIVSRGDRTREKLGFYGAVGVRELLIVDRDPWQLELWRSTEAQLVLQSQISTSDGGSIELGTLPVRFRLVMGQKRPQIEVAHAETGETWEV